MRKRQASLSAHRNQGSSDPRNRTGRTPDLRVQDQPGGRRDFGPRAATGPREASASTGSGRTGLRLGSCEPGNDPGLRSMDLPGGTRASAPDPAGRGTKGFGRRCPPGWEEKLRLRNRQRRTARASALSGSPRGNRKEASACGWTPEEAGPWLCSSGLGSGRRPSKQPSAGDAASAGSSATGQWGPAAMPAPIIFGASGPLQNRARRISKRR
jgi:hypothetical protein